MCLEYFIPVSVCTSSNLYSVGSLMKLIGSRLSFLFCVGPSDFLYFFLQYFIKYDLTIEARMVRLGGRVSLMLCHFGMPKLLGYYSHLESFIFFFFIFANNLVISRILW